MANTIAEAVYIDEMVIIAATDVQSNSIITRRHNDDKGRQNEDNGRQIGLEEKLQKNSNRNNLKKKKRL